MIIHYNNGETEKLIRNVVHLQVIGNGYPVTALLSNGNELTISIDRIEAIIDDDIAEKGKEAENDGRK